MHAGRWMATAALGSLLTLAASPATAGGGDSSGGGLAALLSALLGGGGGAPELPGGGLPELPGGGLPELPGGGLPELPGGGLPGLPGLPGGGGDGGSGEGDRFSCRASAIRVELLDQSLEPVVANASGDPCVAENPGIIQDLDLLGLGTASAVYANTSNGDGAAAEAGVIGLTLNLSDHVITAQVLTAEASGSCNAGAAELSSSSQVVHLAIDGEVVDIPPDQSAVEIPLGPLGTIYANQQIEEENQVTQRALHVDTELARVTVAEAIADVHGNPCEEAPPPQCSDGIDNDGDGKTDHPADPGCTSPEDDDEANPCSSCPQPEPECSDGDDNDDDGLIDHPEDPGCSSPDDDTESNGGGGTCKNRSGGGDDTNPGDHGNDAGCNNPGQGQGRH